MPFFTITNKAKTDLKKMGRYTHEHWGRGQSDQYLTMMDACFHQLAANPHIGKDCNEIRDGYRKFNAGSHVIFYRQTLTNTIEVVRILHGRMDIEARLAVP